MKKVLASVLVSATVLGFGLSGVTAFADDTGDDAQTDIGIGFTDYSPGTRPGDLEIKWAPKTFDFGLTNEVANSAEVYSEDTGKNKYIVVNDVRDKTDGVWKLTAGLSKLQSGSIELVGAELKFDAGKKGYQGTATPEVPGSIIDGTGTAVVNDAQYTLAQGATAIDVMHDEGAAGKTHQGFSVLEMENIELSVPKGSAASGRQYSGKINWTLEDTI
ncbi:WxL domain-containing protein [Enterococcus hulanensis]|uniref:WxL domain-containing protein n=1 Tax=Enterococcus TaxID=1350 RepID=UPI000B5A31AE|nr:MULTISPECIES: WxL domain-containing protein [Enterococcus]MBO0410175.1 WxL domain-containing protein [Enterococcus hulanensis]OTO14658.1 hypothetical protein A5875_003815 [Enterococcus sp. 3H8_DIV0648]